LTGVGPVLQSTRTVKSVAQKKNTYNLIIFSHYGYKENIQMYESNYNE